MTDITVNAYILYSFMAFQSLLLLAVLGVLFRLLFVVGRMRGDINGLREQIAQLREELREQTGGKSWPVEVAARAA